MSIWAEYTKTMKPEHSIHLLARSGAIDEMKKSVTEENLDVQDSRGHSPLMLACYNGHVEVADFLLKQGADPNHHDQMGNTVLMGAAFQGYLEIVQLLVRSGADIRLTNPQGMTARGFAELFGHDDVAFYLESLESQ